MTSIFLSQLNFKQQNVCTCAGTHTQTRTYGLARPIHITCQPPTMKHLLPHDVQLSWNEITTHTAGNERAHRGGKRFCRLHNNGNDSERRGEAYTIPAATWIHNARLFKCLSESWVHGYSSKYFPCLNHGLLAHYRVQSSLLESSLTRYDTAVLDWTDWTHLIYSKRQFYTADTQATSN